MMQVKCWNYLLNHCYSELTLLNKVTYKERALWVLSVDLYYMMPLISKLIFRYAKYLS